MSSRAYLGELEELVLLMVALLNKEAYGVYIAEELQKNDYSTFFAGKWHLGNEGFFPEDQGFEINKGGHHKGSPPGGYYTPYKNPKLSDGPEGEYLTDRLTNESMNFLDTIGEKPFFLYLSYYTVHTPIQPNKQYIDKFKKKREDLGIKEIAYKDEGKGVTTLEQYNPAYASMLYALDKNIGRLIAKLKNEGLYENTTIVFTSDNGGLSTLVKNGKRFLESARKVSRKKPIVLLKGGQTKAGNRAASSHTGALSSDTRIFNAVCKSESNFRLDT